MSSEIDPIPGMARRGAARSRGARATRSVTDHQPESCIARVLGSPWFLAAALALGALLRLVYVLQFRSVPLFDHLQLDHRVYDEWAQRIVHGEWLGTKVFYVDPLYAYFLAALYAVFGRNLLAVRVVHLLLGVGICGFTAILGRRVFGSAAIGNAAALLTAVFAPSVFYESAIDKTVLAVFLSTGALVLFLGRSRRAALAAGLTFGLAILARGNIVLLLPFGVLALLVEPGDRVQIGPWWRRRATARAVLFLSGALAVVGVATAHNWVAGHQLVLTTSNLGVNLYIGHHPGQVTGTYQPPPFVRADPVYEEDDFRAEAERRTGRRLNAAELSAFWTRQAVAEIVAAPGALANRTVQKLWLFWNDYEVPDNDDIVFAAKEYAPVLRLPLVRMGVLFPLALLGLLAWWRRNRGVRLLGGAAVLYCLGVVAFFVLSRLRAPVVPILAVLAAGGVAWLADAVRARNRRALAFAVTVLLVGATVSAIAQPAWIDSRACLGVSYHNFGQLHRQLGNSDAAIAALEEAIGYGGVMMLASRRSVADVYLERGEYFAAERHLLQVLAIKDDLDARTALVHLFEVMVGDPRHRDDPVALAKLAAAYRSVGRSAEAEQVGNRVSALRGHSRQP